MTTMLFIPELVTHFTRYLTASETGIASRTCRTWYNNAYWTLDETEERFREATAQRNVALRDEILERYRSLYPRLLKIAIRAGCVATTERIMAEIPTSDLDSSKLLESCDFTYAICANVPGTISRLRKEGESVLPMLHNFCEYKSGFDQASYVFVRDLSEKHAELLADVKSRQAKLVKFLVGKGAVPFDQLLHLAARSGFDDVVRLLLAAGHVNRYWLESVIFPEVCENKDTSVLCLLLQKGCKVTVECFNRAIGGGSCQAVDVLLQISEREESHALAGQRHEYLQAFLDKAAKCRHVAIVRRILQEECVSVHPWTVSDAVRSGSVSVVEVLVERYENTLCARYRFGCEDLQLACFSNSVAMVRMVFSREKERDEYTADVCLDMLMLWLGWDMQREEIVRYLFGHHSFVSTLSMKQCQKLLLRATEERAVELVKMVLRLPCFSELRLRERKLQTPLCHTGMVSKIQEYYWTSVTFFQALYEVDLPWCSERPQTHCYNYNWEAFPDIPAAT